jgi:opacity protein-like surface antigen
MKNSLAPVALSSALCIASPAAFAESRETTLVAQQSDSALIQQLLIQNAELQKRIEKLESASSTEQAAPADASALIPKNGVYVQADIGAQYRDSAGENGDTVTYLKSGFYGSAGLGYRLSKNFRLSGEYTNQSSNANQVSADYGSGNPLNGIPQPGLGAIVLNQYTFNAYYDAPGFGYKKRIRPYVGLGVGTQKSSLIGISNTFAAPFGLYANGATWAPLVTFQAGAAYVVNKNTEIYAGAKYAEGSELLFRNTAFGNLLPMSSRNWSVSGGVRYTF